MTNLLKKYIITPTRNRWHAEGGFREILILALPLIVSTASWSVQHFVDRMFLTWYSSVTIAASMPAGILNFTIVSLFMGTAGYVSTFVAQYHGAGQDHMAGRSLWQGIYISIIAGIVMLCLVPLAAPLFRVIGHSPDIMKNEVIYFRVLCYAAFPLVASSAISGFFSGIGRTKVIMFSNLAATAVNIILDYMMIFGHGGFSEMGIYGAGVATVISTFVSVLIYMLFLFRKHNTENFHTIKGWRINPDIFRRLLRYGLPSGIQFFLEIAGFTIFLLFIGRLGTVNLAATNIAFNINTLAFMPMIGLGIAISVTVGQYTGKKDLKRAEYSVYSAFYIAAAYMTLIASLYILAPDLFIAPYAAHSNQADFAAISDLTRILLRFVAVYCVFDSLNIIFASAVKGAGDTRFVMYIIVGVSTLVLVIPTYTALFILHYNIYAAWSLATTYIIILALAFFFRFKSGKWKNFRVIEEFPVIIPACMPEGPAGKFEG